VQLALKTLDATLDYEETGEKEKTNLEELIKDGDLALSMPTLILTADHLVFVHLIIRGPSSSSLSCKEENVVLAVVTMTLHCLVRKLRTHLLFQTQLGTW
jgi:hypothetical protein